MDSLGRPQGHYARKGGGVIEQEPREYIADILREIGYGVAYAGDARSRDLKFVPIELRSVGWFKRETESASEYRPVFEILLLNRRCDGCSSAKPFERSLGECTEQHLVPAGETVLDALLSSPYCEVISNSTPSDRSGGAGASMPVPSDLSAIRFRVVATEENRGRVQRSGGLNTA